MRLQSIFAAALVAAVSLSANSATGLELEVGGELGLNYNRLSQPRDLQGEPTLLQGSRFTGFGVHIGPDVRWYAASLDFADLVVDGALLVAFQNGSGFVEDSQSGARRDVDLSLTNLRLPLTVGARYGVGDSSGFTLFAGGELLFGIVAGSEVTEVGVGGEPTPLNVTTATHVGLTGGIEFDFAVTDSFVVPLSVRYAYDPFVPKKTVERFEGFESQDAPGAYTVAFDHMVMIGIGARFRM